MIDLIRKIRGEKKFSEPVRFVKTECINCQEVYRQEWSPINVCCHSCSEIKKLKEKNKELIQKIKELEGKAKKEEKKSKNKRKREINNQILQRQLTELPG